MLMTIGIISSLLTIYLFIAIINPRIFLGGKLTRRQTGLATLGMFILFVVCAVNDSPKSAMPSETKITTDAGVGSNTTGETSTGAEINKIPGTIGMDPQQFKGAFNEASDLFSSNLKITNLNIINGQVQDTFQVMFTDLIGIVGVINKKDGSVRDVMVIGHGDGTARSGLDVLTSFGILIAATNPSLSAIERGSVLNDLGLNDKGVNINDIDKSTIRNGIKYHLMGSDVMGIMFSAGDANDK